MKSELRITPTLARVLRPFLEDPRAPRYGFDLMQIARLPSGTLYPILARLERANVLTRQAEDIDPVVEGRPARKFYRITPEGELLARRELAALSAELQPPPRRALRPQMQRGPA